MTDVQIRLDRSRPFSTCHGDRTPDDPHYRVHFWQGGVLGGNRILLPFDAHGNLVADDGRKEPKEGINSEGKKIMFNPLYDQQMRDFLAAKLRKAQAAPQPAQLQLKEDGDPPQVDELGEDTGDDVNLEAWLRGQAEYPAGVVRDAYARRFHKHTAKLHDIVIDLVLDEKLVPEDAVCPDRAKYLPAKAA